MFGNCFAAQEIGDSKSENSGNKLLSCYSNVNYGILYMDYFDKMLILL